MNDTRDMFELDMRYQVTQRKEAVRQLTVQEVSRYNRSAYYPRIFFALDQAEEELEHYLLERYLKTN